MERVSAHSFPVPLADLHRPDISRRWRVHPGVDLDVGFGAILILLAMPGVLASLLMLEEYGSLIRFLRGDGVFDPYVATIPDEYLFIVLSMTVTGAAALWRWEAIFLDRRDYANLVPLPVRLRTIFLVNFSAITVLAALFTVVVNAASVVLFPVAVVGSQPSFSVFFRFAAGHAAAVFLASVFSFLAVLALAGLLMALFPTSVFRSVSLFARFVIAIGLFALLASSFAVRSFLYQTSLATKHQIAMLPPVWFVGISQTVWGNGRRFLLLFHDEGSVCGAGLCSAHRHMSRIQRVFGDRSFAFRKLQTPVHSLQLN